MYLLPAMPVVLMPISVELPTRIYICSIAGILHSYSQWCFTYLSLLYRQLLYSPGRGKWFIHGPSVGKWWRWESYIDPVTCNLELTSSFWLLSLFHRSPPTYVTQALRKYSWWSGENKALEQEMHSSEPCLYSFAWNLGEEGPKPLTVQFVCHIQS